MNPNDKAAYCVAALMLLIGMAWYLIRVAIRLKFNAFDFIRDCLYWYANWVLAMARGFDMALTGSRTILAEKPIESMRRSMEASR